MEKKIFLVALLLMGVFASIVTVQAQPAWVDAGPDQTVYVGQTVTFILNIPEGCDPGWCFGEIRWDFGDGSPVVIYPVYTDISIVTVTTHVYATSGTYIATLGVEVDGVWFEWVYDTCTITVLPVISVSIDIKPGSWPNPIKTKSRGVLPVCICGTEDFDVMTVDPASVRLYSEDVEEGVAPLRWSWEDVATPYTTDWGGGHPLGGDGILDLVFHFDTPEAASVLTLTGNVGETLPLILRGNLKVEYDGISIYGEDYVWIH
jgi:hypothetical protein